MSTATALTSNLRESWTESRWAVILDRIEFRQASIGLRFWGPPLWLEVTMSGPDSDVWWIAGIGGVDIRSWNWQSVAPCPGVVDLAESGADDDRLLAAASRYTIENLILNATHEIGEWLRFDARRPFPAHGPSSADRAGTGDGTQGNGAVHLRFTFDQAPSVASPSATPRQIDQTAREHFVERITAVAAPWRFTYVSATSISYGPSGPIITDVTAGADPPISYASSWSASTLNAVDAPSAELLLAVMLDVHGLLVRYEADRICRAFHVDGHRPWHLQPSGEDAPTQCAETVHGEPLRVSITYDH